MDLGFMVAVALEECFQRADRGVGIADQCCLVVADQGLQSGDRFFAVAIVDFVQHAGVGVFVLGDRAGEGSDVGATPSEDVGSVEGAAGGEIAAAQVGPSDVQRVPTHVPAAVPRAVVLDLRRGVVAVVPGPLFAVMVDDVPGGFLGEFGDAGVAPQR